MAQSNVLKRYLDAGLSFTEMTQAKAEALVKDLVRTGEVQTEQAQAAVTDLVERSRANTERFIAQVRADIADQAESLGLATLTDLTSVEKRLEERLEQILVALRPATEQVRRAAGKTSSPKKAAAKKSPAKKSTAKKSTAKKSPAKKSAAKKATAKKSAAKKAPAKKAAARTSAS